MYRSYEPAQELCPFIECYWSWSVESNFDSLDDILPDASPEFIVHLGAIPFARRNGGEWRKQCRAFLYCAAQKTLTLSAKEPVKIFAIRFRPWGVSRFSNVSMGKMLDRQVHPVEALNGLGEDLASSLYALNSDADRVRATDRMLKGALQSNSRVEPRLKLLLDAADGGRCSSSEMARHLSVSHRSFNRLWNEVVGIEPRKFIQLMRFHSALELINSGIALKEVAADCGYSDQAHMARQIKAIAGLPPKSLRRLLGQRVYRDLYTARPGAPWRERINR